MISQKKIILAIIIIGIISIGIFLFISQNNNIESETTVNNANLASKAKEDLSITDKLKLDIKFKKNTYEVGESLEGSEYYLEYTGKPFKVMIAYSESMQGLLKKSYSATRGTLQTGNFDNPESLPGLKVSMYSTNSYGAPNHFDCDGNYEYSISVYDCTDIDNALETDDCGNGGWPPTIKTEDIVSKISPLETISKNITVLCPDGITNCCTNYNFRCSFDKDCIDGYTCENNKCKLS